MFYGANSNWAHGFIHGFTAEAFYGRWGTDMQSPKFSEEWTIFCGQNGGDMIFRTNGGENRGKDGRFDLRFPENVLTNGGTENSDFDIMEIITWDRALSSDEVNTVIEYMEAKLTGKCKKFCIF